MEHKGGRGHLTANTTYGPEGIIVVIPALNEEATIGSVVLQSREYASTVIVVDDGSTDRTSKVASLAGAEVIRLEENHGKAYAVARGLTEIFDRSFKAVVLMDGDGQHDPSNIPEVVTPILSGEADLIIGSRLMQSGNKIPEYRKVGQRVLNRFTNIGARQRFTDTQSGFRAMNMIGVRNMDFKSNGYSLESGMIIHFTSRGLRVKEVPIQVSYDVPNKHKKNPVSMGCGLMNSLITQIGLRRPLMFISAPGFALSVVGLIMGFACLSRIYIFGWSWFFESLLAGFLLTIGVVLMVSGLTLNTISHIVSQRETSLPDVLQSELSNRSHEERRLDSPASPTESG